jgi:hypothetical protein
MAANGPKTSNLPRSGDPGYNFRVLQTASGHLVARTAQIELGL